MSELPRQNAKVVYNMSCNNASTLDVFFTASILRVQNKRIRIKTDAVKKSQVTHDFVGTSQVELTHNVTR